MSDRNIGLGLTATFAAIGVIAGVFYAGKPAASEGPEAPRFEVAPLWPKPLPNHWRIGSTIGVSVDAQDHVWVIHRPATLQPKEEYACQNPKGGGGVSPAPPR